jgi:deoxyribose-phosphate aldolase
VKQQNPWWPLQVPDVARLIDHTILKPSATRDDVLNTAREGLELGTASVCVHPSWIIDVAEVLKGSVTRVCSVVGFPSGMHRPQSVAFEADRAIREGAQEIDMVLPIGRAKMGEWELVQGAVATVKAAIGGVVLKVILETCDLTDEEIEHAAHASFEGGADFIKTSTGFGAYGATVKHVELMARVAKEHGGRVKAAGGIRDFATLKAMVQAGADRIGASSTPAILREATEAAQKG